MICTRKNYVFLFLGIAIIPISFKPLASVFQDPGKVREISLFSGENKHTPMERDAQKAKLQAYSDMSQNGFNYDERNLDNEPVECYYTNYITKIEDIFDLLDKIYQYYLKLSLLFVVY